MKKVIRYIGSKEKLIDFLEENMFSKYKDKKIKLLDGFSGSTFISKYCHDNYDWNITTSDISDYSERLSSRMNINNCSVEIIDLCQKIQYEKGLAGIITQEFSSEGRPLSYTEDFFEKNGSRLFFSGEVANVIDNYRNKAKELYESKKINIDELNLILMVALGFADKNANTTSVYGAYLKNQKKPIKYLKEEFFEILKNEKKINKAPVNFIKGDILSTLDKIDRMDLIYLDPPYNTRKYESNYHILNYISKIDFQISDVKINSKTGLPSVTLDNLFGSKSGTRIIFKQMILKAIKKADLVCISYSTDGEITVEEVLKICNENNIECEVLYKDYKRFKANVIENSKDLKEILFKMREKNG